MPDEAAPETNFQKRLRILESHNKALTELFSDPQPGLITWIQAVARRVEAMNSIVSGDKIEEF